MIPSKQRTTHRPVTCLDSDDSVLNKVDPIVYGKTTGELFNQRQTRHKELREINRKKLDSKVYSKLAFAPMIYKAKRDVTPTL